MARYRGPSCRLCRREGTKLFLKGRRCSTDKCSFGRRKGTPGPRKRFTARPSDYGLQLREKQKLKRVYGILERQFRGYFHKAERSRGVTGEVLLQLLERRLDNVVYRMSFGASRQQARQLVRCGFILVNKRRIDIPSYQVKKGDLIQIKSGEKRRGLIKKIIEESKDSIPPRWIELNREKFEGKIIELPRRADISFPIKEQLIIELYSK